MYTDENIMKHLCDYQFIRLDRSADKHWEFLVNWKTKKLFDV